MGSTDIIVIFSGLALPQKKHLIFFCLNLVIAFLFTQLTSALELYLNESIFLGHLKLSEHLPDFG